MSLMTVSLDNKIYTIYVGRVVGVGVGVSDSISSSAFQSSSSSF